MEKMKQKWELPNRKYKDAVFRMLFREKEELLVLFNAVHGTCYEDPEELEVTTLENAVYMSMKNDISCVLDMQLALYEHQSTVNANIPLRDLFYVSKLFETRVEKGDLYTNKLISLPAPKFIVFYNGREKQPERKVYKLSDSYAKKSEGINLELIVVQININPGYNEELVKKCQTLFEYIQYTDRIRCYTKEMSLPEAVERAINECIDEGILADFLRKNRGEVIPMSIFEYDEEKHLQAVREEGYEEGIERLICNMLRDNQAPEQISKYAERPLEYIYQIEQKMLAEVRERGMYEIEELQ